MPERRGAIMANLGPEFIVDTTIASSQTQANVVTLADGRFLITWTSSEGSSDDVRARLFEADGTPAGDDFIVNSTMADEQYNSSAAALASGGFVVAWNSNEGGTSQFDVRVRVFDAD